MLLIINNLLASFRKTPIFEGLLDRFLVHQHTALLSTNISSSMPTGAKLWHEHPAIHRTRRDLPRRRRRRGYRLIL